MFGLYGLYVWHGTVYQTRLGNPGFDRSPPPHPHGVRERFDCASPSHRKVSNVCQRIASNVCQSPDAEWSIIGILGRSGRVDLDEVWSESHRSQGVETVTTAVVWGSQPPAKKCLGMAVLVVMVMMMAVVLYW